MRIDRVQERVARKAIGSAGKIRAGRIVRASVTTDFVVAAIAEVGIVNAELGVVKDIEGFGAEFYLTAFADGEVLQDRHVKI